VAWSIATAGCPGDRVDKLFWSYDQKHPGASVMVIKDGKVVLERSYGLANLATGEKVTPDTNFRLASVTKQFTAAAVSILAKQKKLAYGDLITKYFPELAEIAHGVTLKHLLTHTSGLPEYDRLLPDNDKTQISDRDVLKLLLKQKPIEGKPGTRYAYNNTGYALLALVIEKVSKKSFADFLQQNIFSPLGMTSTLVYSKTAAIAHRAYGYSGEYDSFAAADQARDTAVLGDGGVYSSTRDLAKWISGLENNTVLDAKQLAECTSEAVKTTTPGLSYGLGWRITDFNGEKLVFHTGTTSGFKNVVMWVPSRKLAVVVLTNRKQGEPLTLGLQVLDEYWTPTP
jgi:CubicO group peptidase (beta-lactamase class C family)